MKKQTILSPSKLRQRGNLSPIRPRQKMPTVYRHRKVLYYMDPHEDPLRFPRDNSFLKSRLIRQVQIQRDEMLIKTGRTSVDNPEWMSTNLDHYRKLNFNALPKSSIMEQRHYDVLNNSKTIVGGRNEDAYFVDMIREGDWDRRQGGMGRSRLDSTFRSTLSHSLGMQAEISSKVGAVNERDYSIFRPQLKVGSNQFVDTYTVF